MSITCKMCGADVSGDLVNSPDWDGETCSQECREDLEGITKGLPWHDLDPESELELSDDAWEGYPVHTIPKKKTKN